MSDRLSQTLLILTVFARLWFRDQMLAEIVGTLFLMRITPSRRLLARAPVTART